MVKTVLNSTGCISETTTHAIVTKWMAVVFVRNSLFSKYVIPKTFSVVHLYDGNVYEDMSTMVILFQMSKSCLIQTV